MGQTPFKALFGKHTSIIPHFEPNNFAIEVVEIDRQGREQALDSIKANLARAQLRMKTNANKHRRELEFKPGDLVLVRLQPYR